MGDYPAALADEQQALELFRRLGDRLGQAWALDELGLLHQVTGDYPAAAASSAAALELFHDLGDRHGLSKALNSLGELSLRTGATGEAARQFGEALALTRELGTPHEEARALEGIGRSLLGRDLAEAARRLREALEIYQRIGVPEALARPGHTGPARALRVSSHAARRRSGGSRLPSGPRCPRRRWLPWSRPGAFSRAHSRVRTRRLRLWPVLSWRWSWRASVGPARRWFRPWSLPSCVIRLAPAWPAEGAGTTRASPQEQPQEQEGSQAGLIPTPGTRRLT